MTSSLRVQVLLTIGIQRETAGRGTMALYIQVCPFDLSQGYSLTEQLLTDHLRSYLRTDILSYLSVSPLHNRDNHHPVLRNVHRSKHYDPISFRNHLISWFMYNSSSERVRLTPSR